MPCHLQRWSLAGECIQSYVSECCTRLWINVFTPTPLPSGGPTLPSFHRNFQTRVGAEFSSSLLTVDCKCLNLGRQPFLITRITLLSNRKIKLNNTIAYSWSQTAALRTHQSPVKLLHAPPSTHTFTHKQPSTDNIQNGNLLSTCVAALAPHLVWSQCTSWEKKALFFCNIYSEWKKRRLKWKTPLRVPVAY